MSWCFGCAHLVISRESACFCWILVIMVWDNNTDFRLVWIPHCSPLFCGVTWGTPQNMLLLFAFVEVCLSVVTCICLSCYMDFLPSTKPIISFLCSNSRQVPNSTYQYRVKTTYITTFFFSLLLCFPEHCFCCLCLLFYPILYSFLFYSLLACVVILSHCVSFFLLSFCLNVERIVKLNLFQPI